MFKKVFISILFAPILAVQPYLSASEVQPFEPLPEQLHGNSIKTADDIRPSILISGGVLNDPAEEGWKRPEEVSPHVFKFDANAIIETYLRKVISQNMLNGDLRKNLNDIAVKLDKVIVLAGRQGDFVKRIFSPEKAIRFQENLTAISELIYVTCKCFPSVCKDLPSIQAQEQIKIWEKEADSTYAKAGGLIEKIALGIKNRNTKTQATVNQLQEVLLLKARKLQESVVELAKICNPKTDRIAILEVLFNQISLISVGEKEWLLEGE